MAFSKPQVVRQSASGIIASHVVLRNTYLLLGLSLLFSAGSATFAMLTNAAPLGLMANLIGMFGLLFLVQALKDSAWGLLAVFAFTGFMGYTLGPILNLYLTMFSNGYELIMTALGSTGIIFLALSTYVLTTGKNFSYLGGFLFAAVMVAFLAGIASMLFHMPMLNLIVSGAFALISCGMILFHTSQIIEGGERNYISATISLYVALFNLFISLLRILAFFAGSSRD